MTVNSPPATTDSHASAAVARAPLPLTLVPALFLRPGPTWDRIRAADYSVARVLLGHTVWFAAIAPICGYVGTTVVGWSLGPSAPVKLTQSSAAQIAVAYFVAMLVAVLAVAWAIRWMAHTYGTDKPLGTCLALASFTATPLFLVGLAHLYPLLWVNFLIGLLALGLTVALFYSGVPRMMEISVERGFLFSSAVLCFGMTALVATLAVTASLWSLGFGPAFTF